MRSMSRKYRRRVLGEPSKEGALASPRKGRQAIGAKNTKCRRVRSY
jgi:hypothetical protein